MVGVDDSFFWGAILPFCQGAFDVSFKEIFKESPEVVAVPGSSYGIVISPPLAP